MTGCIFFLLEIIHICLSVIILSGRDKMQPVISLPLLSLPLKTQDKHICIISSKKEKDCSRYKRKMLLDQLFLFKMPSAFDIFQSQFNNNTVCNYGALRVSIATNCTVLCWTDA